MNGYVVAIGGSGIRTLTSLYFLCAMGYIRESELQVLVIDTDKDNGNTLELEKVAETYDVCRAAILGLPDRERAFFRTNIVLKKCFHLADGLNNLKSLIHFTAEGMDSAPQGYDFETPELFAKALFGESGYRDTVFSQGFYGQPSVGALVFAHCLDKNNEIKIFAQEMIGAASRNVPTRLILLGSLFGGTGAAGMTSYLKYLNKSTNSSQRETVAQNLKVAAVPLLPYLTFLDPEHQQSHVNPIQFRQKAKNVLQYLKEYEETLKKSQKNIQICSHYIIDFLDKAVEAETDKLTIRGSHAEAGVNQYDWPHLAELIAALSIKHFLADDQRISDYYFRCDMTSVSPESIFIDDNGLYQAAELFAEVSTLFNHLFYEELFPLKKDGTRGITKFNMDIYWNITRLNRKDVKGIFRAFYDFGTSYLRWAYEMNHSFLYLKGKEYDAKREAITNNSCLFHLPFFQQDILARAYVLVQESEVGNRSESTRVDASVEDHEASISALRKLQEKTDSGYLDKIWRIFRMKSPYYTVQQWKKFKNDVNGAAFWEHLYYCLAEEGINNVVG